MITKARRGGEGEEKRKDVHLNDDVDVCFLISLLKLDFFFFFSLTLMLLFVVNSLRFY